MPTRTMLKMPGSMPTRTMGNPRKTFAGTFPVHLYQYGWRYAVQYGQQLDWDLSYREACARLGEALMHRASIDGVIDGVIDGEIDGEIDG